MQVFVRMSGNEHGRQPTVILRVPAPGEWRMLGCVHEGQPTVISVVRK